VAVDVSHRMIQGDGVQLHVAIAGDGPCVVLLHGFPEDWRTWTHQIPPLVAAGFRVVAPDLRGYNESGRPDTAGAYHLRHLVADVAALVRGAGCDRAHIVGHDWGGILAWTFAGLHPELVDRLVILNAPHVRIFRRRARPFSAQWRRSWYTAVFRTPHVAEWLLSARHFWFLRDLFQRRPALPAFTAEQTREYIEALSRPGALTAALRWYRDNADQEAIRMASSARSLAPTLIIWGERDPTLGIELLAGLDEVAPDLSIHRIARASHWVQNEAPDEVSRALIEFLSRS
jgi:pimeloyl-ACP methyl ester carboxylesterase